MPIRLIDKGTPLPALSPQGGERVAAGRERGSCLQDQNLSINRIGMEILYFSSCYEGSSFTLAVAFPRTAVMLGPCKLND